MSPRKSSTSSGRPERPRARYLGVEVAGEPFPALSPPRWIGLLQRALLDAGAPHLAFRLMRSEGPRAVVRVTQWDAGTARRAWNSRTTSEGEVSLRTRRTWGTLVGAKAWASASAGVAARPRRDPRRSPS